MTRRIGSLQRHLLGHERGPVTSGVDQTDERGAGQHGHGEVTELALVAGHVGLKAVPDADAYQLALDVDGPSLTQNVAATPAAVDQSQGPVVYAKDPSVTGFVDVYYYLMGL